MLYGANQPLSQVNDSIQLDLATNKVQDIIVFEVGNLCMVTGGANAGRVGTMISRYILETYTSFMIISDIMVSGRSTLDHSTLCTSRIPRATSLPLGSTTSLSLARWNSAQFETSDFYWHVPLPSLLNVFISQGNKPFISLPKGKGVKLSIAEERDKRLGVKA